MQDYAHFTLDPAMLNTQLDCLVSLYGREKIAGWQTLANTGAMETLVDDLLRNHYDPAYLRSIQRNFSQLGQAQTVVLDDITEAAFAAAARVLHQAG
jgi:tRNA 2-selenouridine synthase